MRRRIDDGRNDGILKGLILLCWFMYAGDAYLQPLFSPDGERLMFTGERFQGLYVHDIVRGSTIQIVDTPGAGYYANWSPDGMRIGFKMLIPHEAAFLQAPAIYELATNEIRLLHRAGPHAGTPTFSKDGKIAFTIGDQALIMDRTETILSEIHLGHHVNLAVLSPQGDRIVYNDIDDQLWIVQIDGSARRRITEGDDGYFAPQWSPDGSKILAKTLTSLIVVINHESERMHRIDEGSSPHWLADGEKLIYARETRDPELRLSSSEIYTAKYDGGEKACLLPNGGLCQYPHVSGQMDRLVYVSGEDREIFISRIERMSVASPVALSIGKVSAVRFQLPSIDILPTEGASKVLDAPYIHQVYDTPDWFLAGHSACGATSAMMGIAYYHVLPAWPTICSSPYRHTSDYGRYISDVYNFNGYTYNIKGYNSRGNYGYGGFGFIVQHDWADTKGYMSLYLRQHRIGSSVDWYPNLSKIDAEIAQDYPLVILTSITDAGHYQLVVGHEADSHSIIVNDPYGNDNRIYMNYEGKKVSYDWPGYNNGHVNLNIVWCYIYMRYAVPDLAVSGFALPDTAAVGDRLTVRTTFSNIGSGDARNIRIAYYLSTNSFFDDNDLLLHGLQQDFLGIDDSLTISAEIPIPDTLKSRRYGLGIRIDDGDHVSELSENNNLRYETLIIKGFPEIYQRKPDPDSIVDTGTPVIAAKYRDTVLPIDESSIGLQLNGVDVTASCENQKGEITFIPPSPLSPGAHQVMVRVGNIDGYIKERTWSFTVTATDVTTEGTSNAPLNFELYQNHPNPFNAETRISYSLPASAEVSLIIYAIDGTRVRHLLRGMKTKGTHVQIWDGRNDRGEEVSSGMYFYQLQTAELKESKRLVLLK